GGRRRRRLRGRGGGAGTAAAPGQRGGVPARGERGGGRRESHPPAWGPAAVAEPPCSAWTRKSPAAGCFRTAWLNAPPKKRRDHSPAPVAISGRNGWTRTSFVAARIRGSPDGRPSSTRCVACADAETAGLQIAASAP